jgi:hypothetical protein
MGASIGGKRQVLQSLQRSTRWRGTIDINLASCGIDLGVREVRITRIMRSYFIVPTRYRLATMRSLWTTGRWRRPAECVQHNQQSEQSHNRQPAIVLPVWVWFI